MIVVKLMGGLGNQMFQYAVGRALSEKNKVPLKLDISFLQDKSPRPDFTYRNYELNIFNIKESFATKEETDEYLVKPKKKIPRLLYKLRQSVYPKRYVKEKFHHYDSQILNSCKNSYLEGYWQTDKYFKNIESIIRDEFEFKYPTEGKITELQNKIKSLNSVSIHIRRGDYVSNAATNSFHGVCSLEYYTNSINYMKERVGDSHFFVFSDDIQWVKDNLKINGAHSFVENDKSVPAHEDLRLMSSCKHHIIANSSFSWWAAWLNKNKEKIVLAPKHWFNDKNINTSDIIPEAWIWL